jgi:hypothetical protein
MSLLPLSVKLVFSEASYIALAALVTISFWILFNVFDQLLFFQPIWIFYLPDDAVTAFILTSMVSILLGVLVSMNVYIIRHSKIRIGRASLFSGSALCIISGICSSCSSIGLLLISAFGSIGVIASNLLTIYQVPLRVVSLVILIFALYSIHRRITTSIPKSILDESTDKHY